MVLMKWIAVLPLSFAALAAAGPGDVRAVYLLPMAGGFDQYLANRITNAGLYQVVTDPKLADAVFTDRLGQAFQDRMEELYPKEDAPAAEPAKQGKAAEEKTNAAGDVPAMFGDTRNKLEAPGHMSTFGRGRGTVFLVDVKSRAVLWSVFNRPKDKSPKELDRAAEQITTQIKKAAGRQ